MTRGGSYNSEAYSHPHRACSVCWYCHRTSVLASLLLDESSRRITWKACSGIPELFPVRTDRRQTTFNAFTCFLRVVTLAVCQFRRGGFLRTSVCALSQQANNSYVFRSRCGSIQTQRCFTVCFYHLPLLSEGGCLRFAHAHSPTPLYSGAGGHAADAYERG